MTNIEEELTDLEIDDTHSTKDSQACVVKDGGISRFKKLKNTLRKSSILSLRTSLPDSIKGLQKLNGVSQHGNKFKTTMSTLSPEDCNVLLPSSNADIVATELRVEMKSDNDRTATSNSLWNRIIAPILGQSNSREPSESSVNLKGSKTNAHSTMVLKKGTKFFTVYKIAIRNGQKEWSIYKRYSEFCSLDKMIRRTHPLHYKNLPSLPPKTILGSSMSPQFIEQRAKSLHNYIQQVFKIPALINSESVSDFLFGSSSSTSISTPVMQHSLKPLSQVEAEMSSDEDFHDRLSCPPTPDIVFGTFPENSSVSRIPSRAPFSKILSKVESNDKSLNEEKLTSTMLYPVLESRLKTPAISDKSSKSSSSNIAQCVTIDDFYLLKMIGRGSFGKVMLAQHKVDQKVYAIKVISKSSVKRVRHGAAGAKPHDIDHIMAERNVLIRSVNHPFLIGLKWAFQTKEKLYFVTEYVNGGEIFFHLQRECRFSELRARFYAAEIVSALAYLHIEVDVIYRDLKPENILLDSEGHIKLTDFGLAKEKFFQSNKGRTQTFCGTPEYLAPEIIRKESYGFSIDWWCLGSVLYEMLVGLPPFYSKDTNEMFHKIQNEKLKFPSYVGIRARSIISGLLHRSPYFRLGTGPNNTSNPDVVKMHPFFEGIDWEKLFKREYKPPFVPNVQHMYDLRNIDPQFVNEPIPKSVLEDNPFKDAVQVEVFSIPVDSNFEGFTFVGGEHWMDED